MRDADGLRADRDAARALRRAWSTACTARRAPSTSCPQRPAASDVLLECCADRDRDGDREERDGGEERGAQAGRSGHRAPTSSPKLSRTSPSKSSGKQAGRVGELAEIHEQELPLLVLRDVARRSARGSVARDPRDSTGAGRRRRRSARRSTAAGAGSGRRRRDRDGLRLRLGDGDELRMLARPARAPARPARSTRTCSDGVALASSGRCGGHRLRNGLRLGLARRLGCSDRRLLGARRSTAPLSAGGADRHGVATASCRGARTSAVRDGIRHAGAAATRRRPHAATERRLEQDDHEIADGARRDDRPHARTERGSDDRDGDEERGLDDRSGPEDAPHPGCLRLVLGRLLVRGCVILGRRRGRAARDGRRRR